jgi:hypothetical protein
MHVIGRMVHGAHWLPRQRRDVSKSAGRFDEAIALLEATVDDRELVLGPEYRCRATFLR